MREDVQVEYITNAAQLANVAAVFSAAFHDDPGLQYLCRHEFPGYAARLSAWMRAMLNLQLANQQPLLGIRHHGDYVACATLTLPDTKLATSSLVRWLWESFRGCGASSVWHTLSHIQSISRYLPQLSHVRLEFIAVHPAHQGKGYARLLLDEIHNLSQRHSISTGVWLETANPANILLYEKFGYHVTGCIQLSSVVTSTTMFRST
jgi:ribosomal protein S18 acetylase RimI-like enzyme